MFLSSKSIKPLVDSRRIFALNEKPSKNSPVIYWMSRDQRVHDNWALLHAQALAEEYKQPLVVVFCLVPNFLEATIRQYGFMLKGLEEVETELKYLNISFHLLLGDLAAELPKFAHKINAGVVVTDFDPLRIKKQWRESVAKKLNCSLLEVDAHNIVPCRFASPKQEFAAYTLRPKISKLLMEFLTPFPKLKKQKHATVSARVNWKKVRSSLNINMEVQEVGWCKPGEKAAQRALKKFIDNGLKNYDSDRNDPTKDGQSGLSPYLHFGQLSAQRIALEVLDNKAHSASDDAFIEELVVRRELSDNFCLYNPHYDTVEGFPAWAKKSLAEHESDKREYIYSRRSFEEARTHDPLWNAAQLQMLHSGKMHGYMRMYWAKKILEWTKSPADAMRIAIYLNDKYELDGRDPNGYAGIAWSIGGVHDRAWFDRPVFGKIRYMNYNGCKSKFDVDEYVNTFAV